MSPAPIIPLQTITGATVGLTVSIASTGCHGSVCHVGTSSLSLHLLYSEHDWHIDHKCEGNKGRMIIIFLTGHLFFFPSDSYYLCNIL